MISSIRQCGTICEAFYFDPKFAVSVSKVDTEEVLSSPDGPPSRDECEFASRGFDHQGVYIFMRQLTRERLVTVALTLRHGLAGDHLPYPADYVAKKLAALPQDERDEAWELFGKGVEP